MTQNRLHLLVTGIVQGVFFRKFTTRTARELGLSGWVRNLADGRVEVLAEGERGALEQLKEACRRGPQYAKVEDLSSRWENFRGEFEAFKSISSAIEPLQEHRLEKEKSLS